MLKKLFNGSQASNNSLVVLTGARTAGIEKDDWDERTGYAKSLTQLDEFEARLREMLQVLTRHCQAITGAGVLGLSERCDDTDRILVENNQTLNQPSTATTKRPSDDPLGLINMFRVSAIAPLQSLLILVPQLRVRCEHRKSAMQLMLRYQRKVLDIERATKTETSRLQRNRAKFQAAAARFRDLDSHVQQEIRIIVSNDILAIVERPTRELLLRAQYLAGQTAVDRASQFQSQDEPCRSKVEVEDPAHDKITEVTVSQDPPQQLPTPQRRMAMTVLPLVHDDNNNQCYVRQSILAPPIQPELNHSGIYKQSRHSSTTTSDDEESASGDTHDDVGEEASGYETTGNEVHEDYGIGKRKKHVHGTRTWDIHQHIKDNMSTGLDLVECVRLPDGFARDEWIAVHVVDFFNEVNLLYGTISEFCTEQTCPRMSAGPCYAYTWSDAGTSGTTQEDANATVATVSAAHLPASEYVARLMDWIERQINDPRVFPANATTYQPDFEPRVACVILKRLFRVYAHMYHSHLDHFAELSAEVHLGFCFKRFVFFVTHFGLVEQKELNALRKLVRSVLENPVDALAPSSDSSADTCAGHGEL